MGNISAKENEKTNIEKTIESKVENTQISDTLGGGREKKIISKFRKKRKNKKGQRQYSKKINIGKFKLNYLLKLQDNTFDLVIDNYSKINLLNNIVAEMPPSEYRHFINNLNKYKKELDEIKDKISEEKYDKINHIYSNILDNNKLDKKLFIKKQNAGNKKLQKIPYKTRKGRNKKYKRSNNYKMNTSRRDKYNTNKKQYYRGKQMRRYHRFKN